ncbi:collagenase [Actinomadura fulvescens]|uniref:microbial collagenase n=1 Tax=Actinomadura fulvescens TaxID=46160 RepID=A0ABN3QPE2_9ACTN
MPPALMALVAALIAVPGPAEAAPPSPRPNPAAAPPVGAKDASPPHLHEKTPVKNRPPLPAPTDHGQPKTKAAAAACDISVFTRNTGAALVNAVRNADISCISDLYNVRGDNARLALNESQMVTVANAFAGTARSYTGDNSQRIEQLLYFLRAGYFVEYYYPDETGSYGANLAAATRSGIDAFFASSGSVATTEAHGKILLEAVTLIDSAAENIRYLYVVKRLLDNYRTSYGYNMQWGVNAAFTVTFRGHYVSGFGAAAQSAGIPATLYNFAVRNFGQLNTEYSTLVGNAGSELSRFLQYEPQRTAIRPQVRDLLSRSSMTGPTATLWVWTAERANYYDQDNCSYYGTCNLPERLNSSVLRIRHTCSSSLRIAAQDLTSSQLSSTCSSLANQDAYFHNVAKDSGPVANDYNTLLEVVVFNSDYDYKLYAGAMFGIDTNNGGMYLEGNPAVVGNLPRFIAFERGTEIWNLNHEYTHYLDGRYNTWGPFSESQKTPVVWWTEGVAEYISYHYRGVPYSAALAAAGRRTYSLSTLFDTTYENSDTARIYQWGYLASRFMIERRWNDTARILAYYRTGNWNAARTYVKSLNLDTEFYNWLGTLGSSGGELPTCSGSTWVMGKNCQRGGLAAGTGGSQAFTIYIPAGTTRLTVKAKGGTGDANIYFHDSTWATNTTYTQYSNASGNADTVTVTGSGLSQNNYNYITLYGYSAFSGVTLSTEY